MDPTDQLYEADATGWKRGLYEDVKRTFRAPFVNWVFRATMANYPALLRYAWGQIKPAFRTRAFARFSVTYRDAVLTAAGDLPTYRRTELGIRPAEYRELRGQVATFDVVAPRLAVLFELLDRGVNGEAIGAAPGEDRAATEPSPEWLDRDRGLSPTMIDPGGGPAEARDPLDGALAHHDLDHPPSVYRCLAQWPPYFRRAWDDVEPVLTSDAFGAAADETDRLVGEFVDGLAYRPRLAPDDLRAVDVEDVDGIQALVGQFSRDPVRGVVRALPVYAATLDVAGERALG